MSPRLSALNRDKFYIEVNTLSQDNRGHPYDFRRNNGISLRRPISIPTIAVDVDMSVSYNHVQMVKITFALEIHSRSDIA